MGEEGGHLTGLIFYSGPSQLDSKPIVAIATVGSRNRKTGDMIQTWILRRDVDPIEAIKSGKDSSICGDCYHRGSGRETSPVPRGTASVPRPRTCYVNVGQAPLAIWRAYQRGSYARGTLAELPDRPLRMGAYGDPVAVPWHAWQGLHDRKVWTGYTHQWRQLIATPFRNVLMASCDGPVEAMEAARAGWRAFVVQPLDEPGDGILCPSVSHGTPCASCGLCSGLQKPDAPSIWIEAHGTSKRFVGVS